MYCHVVLYAVISDTGELHKSIPAYSEFNSRLADLIINSVSINSGYTSILKENANTELMDQVRVRFSLFHLSHFLLRHLPAYTCLYLPIPAYTCLYLPIL